MLSWFGLADGSYSCWGLQQYLPSVETYRGITAGGATTCFMKRDYSVDCESDSGPRLFLRAVLFIVAGWCVCVCVVQAPARIRTASRRPRLATTRSCRPETDSHGEPGLVTSSAFLRPFSCTRSPGLAICCSFLAKADQATKCIGDNRYGRVVPPSGVKFRFLGTGGDHACGITDAGRLYCERRSMPPSSAFAQLV